MVPETWFMVYHEQLGHTLSRLWKTREFLKATTDHAKGPAAYAKVTCTNQKRVRGRIAWLKDHKLDGRTHSCGQQEHEPSVLRCVTDSKNSSE